MEKILQNKVLIFPIANNQNSSAAILSTIKPQLIILSGGSDTENRISTEKEIIRHSISNSCPILGVCHGMQVLNEYFGGSSTRVEGHINVTHEIYPVNESVNEKIFVNSFHRFGIEEDSLGKDLQALWKDKSGNIEAYIGKYHKILGIMWHPERLINSNENMQNWTRKRLRILMA